jgi:plastocyanin
MRVRTRPLAALLAACALAAAGCGDDSDDNESPGGRVGPQDGESSNGGGGGYYGGGGGSEEEESGGKGPGTNLMLSADPSGALKFDKTSLSAKPGKVTIVMDNPSDVPHAVEIEGEGVEEEGETVGKGGVSKVSADLKAGEYEFYCPVGNHADAGMEGTLTVG